MNVKFEIGNTIEAKIFLEDLILLFSSPVEINEIKSMPYF